MLGTAVALSILGTACVNDDYDLSDIDTTTQVRVDDLVIPVNISDVTMGDIISYDDDSKIKPVTIGGKTFYALSETGTFSSKEIEVAAVTASAPVLSSTERYLDPVAAPAPARSAASVTYEISSMGNDVDYRAGSVDDAIVSISSIRTEMLFAIDLNILQDIDAISSVVFDDVRIQMPVGLDADSRDGSYDPATGVWTVARLDAGASASTRVELHVHGIDFVQSGTTIDDSRRLSYSGEFRILGGTVTLGIDGAAPDRLHFRADYRLTDMVATAFSGVISYHLEGLDIAPVKLTDLPDFLTGEGTDITLSAPQIYLGVNNPVAANSLDCAAGLTLTALRDNAPAQAFSLDGGRSFEVGHDHGVAGPYNFVLTPPSVSELNTPAKYEANLKRVDFTSLSGLLAAPAGSAAAGLPTQIDIHLDNPRIPTSPVTDFALGRKLPGVEGTYELVAPLSITAGSRIVYTDKLDGWSDETLDALTISTLSLTATVSNNTPLAVELFAWPIDVDGRRIPGVEVRSTRLAAGAADAPVTIDMTGTVTGLDGVEIEARVEGSADDSALTPSQRLILKNIRARVSGYYEKEF